ncbi:VWA domain-containing protein [Sorangium sp. So ce1151]|uniref:VWA domain-containing protein n=1 Tax=Sorangium sp. So ce1151 TaxID=3133332 RepID=UPI003F60611D
MVVKFHDDVPLPYEDGAEEHVRRLGAGPWDRLVAEFPGITLRRAYTSLDPVHLRKLVKTAERRTPSYRPYSFLSVFRIECPAEVDPHALVRALAGWPAVEEVYVEPRVWLAVVNAGPNPDVQFQSYLNPAPEGIDALYAWTVQGGDGNGQVGADIEFGWMPEHEDFAGQPLSLSDGMSSTETHHVNHGTSAVGVVCARDNTLGVCGIAPNLSQFHLVSKLDSNGVERPLYDTILAALFHLSQTEGEGHVLLLEIGAGKKAELPVEIDPQVLEAIKLVTATGHVVIEPAGNSGTWLDSVEDGNGKFCLDRNSPDFVDSGAIVVGAGLLYGDHPRASWSGYGSRVDCYAQGDWIYTCQAHPAGYTSTFNGTSGASAIIAGAVLSIQGMAQAKLGKRLSPAAVRALLRNPALGTPSKNGASEQIGSMPNLKAIAGVLNKPQVVLATPTVVFLTLFQGQMIWNAAVFEVTALEDITLEVESPPVFIPPYGETHFGRSAKVAATGGQTAKAVLWFSFHYLPGLAETVQPQEVIVRCNETGEKFTVQLLHKNLSSPYLATVLVLDQSGSMLGLAGQTGLTKIEALRQAASTFAALNPFTVDTWPGNQLGTVGFATQAAPLTPITLLSDAAVAEQFSASLTEIQAQPQGKTAIGLGLREAEKMLGELPANPAAPSYTKSILVFTDGLENVEPKIAEVIGDMDPSTHVYAVGLGTPAQVSTDALAALTAATGGYCLLTGDLQPDTEDYFRLSKYFMQVLFDLLTEDVSTDPEGVLLPGQSVRVPFVVSEADARAQVVLLTDVPVVELEVETPAGTLLLPGAPGVSFGGGPYVRFCRVTLPQGTAHAGTWHARLTVATKLMEKSRHVPADVLRRALREGVRYSVSASARSSLRMQGAVSQGSFRPGEPLRARVTLTEYGVPVAARARVEARVRSPGGSVTTVPLTETEPGLFELSFPTARAGAYEVRLLASGRTFRGNRFTRERVLTGAILTESTSPVSLATPQHECCRETRRLLRVLVLLGGAAVLLLLLLLLVALLAR